MASRASRAFNFRTHLVFIGVLVAGLVIIGRLSVLQVRDHQVWLAKAASQQRRLKAEPERGEIFWQGKDGKLHPAATFKHYPYVWAVPKEVAEPEKTSRTLAAILGLDEGELLRKLSKRNDPYELIQKRVAEPAVAKIKAENLKGIQISEEKTRYYPFGELASHVLGFVAENESGWYEGKYGVEAFFDKILNGNSAELRGELVPLSKSSAADIVLTIDPNIQFEAERLLEASFNKWRAKSATVIVMESQTGRILALANQPTFDPNEFGKVKNLENFLNRSISLRFEPGSVFKPFTMAAGLESGAVTPETTYYDSGVVQVGGYDIKNAGNSAPKKQITMTRLLERSYNVGAVFVATKTGADYLRQFFLERFGFEEKTGIDLPGEIKGDLANLKPPEGKPVNFATASFGQGVAITPLKLIQAFNVFANGGYLLKPFVVDRIIGSDGKISVTEPQRLRQVVSRQTLEGLIPMLESVVSGEHGSGKLARLAGYRIAGKTGTGEIPYENGRGYYPDRVNHSFVGFGPISAPRVTILVRLEEPIGAKYAEATAVPVFRDLMKFILNYYGIPPDNPEELE